MIDRVKSYDPTADEALLNRAYVYAMRMHGSQTRASGDPYFAHPIEVAGILTEYKLDAATIVAGPNIFSISARVASEIGRAHV